MRSAIVLLSLGAALAAADRGEYFSTDAGPVNISLVHHASLVLEGMGRVIYVDPTGEGSYKGLPKPDLILITNDRPDHLDASAISHYSKKTTAVIAPEGPKLAHCTPMSKGETVHFGEILIEAVQAARGNGYIITYPGLRVYISGDTNFFPEMKNIKNIEVAFLAIGTPDTLSLDDAAKAVLTMKPKFVYPYHYRDTDKEEIRKRVATGGTEIRMRDWY